jgi:hypothetical protein
MSEIHYLFTNKSYYGFTSFFIDDEKIIFSSRKSFREIIIETNIISMIIINLLLGYILYFRIPFNAFIIILSPLSFFLFFNLLKRVIKTNLVINYKNNSFGKYNFFTSIFRNTEENNFDQLKKIILVRYKGDLEEVAFFTYQVKILGKNKKIYFSSSRIPEAEPASKIATYISKMANIPMEYEFIGD